MAKINKRGQASIAVPAVKINFWRLLMPMAILVFMAIYVIAIKQTKYLWFIGGFAVIAILSEIARVKLQGTKYEKYIRFRSGRRRRFGGGGSFGGGARFGGGRFGGGGASGRW